MCVHRRTHAVKVVEDLVHSYDFIVQLIVAVGGGQERVAIGYKHVEQIDHLQDMVNLRDTTTLQQREERRALLLCTILHVSGLCLALTKSAR